ncbi:mitochondrial thiamine pyrophosphate carrier isoform X2 [Orussus abietinus]|nr:mitochondrial thiamine pyrophosphate carrier isoform X2 [Orussus abietinus]
MLQATNSIVKDEGVLALWKGHVPAQLLSIIYGTGQFYAYHRFTKFSENLQIPESLKRPTQFMGGAFAGCVGTVLSYPFDTVRTRLVAQSTNRLVYKGIVDSFGTIMKTESPRAFFQGLWPTLLQIAPHTGIQFLFYNIFTDLCKFYSSDSSSSMTKSMFAGSAAGLVAKTAVYPFDLARKRMQIQGFEEGRVGFGKFFRCKGMVDCLVVTVKDEGIKGLFKGLVPSQLKAAATTALHFTVYEQTVLLIQRHRVS